MDMESTSHNVVASCILLTARDTSPINMQSDKFLRIEERGGRGEGMKKVPVGAILPEGSRA